MNEITIAPLLPEHAGAVLQIYKEGLETGQATFNTDVPTWEQWDRGHHQHSRLVAVDGTVVAGWVALSPVSVRQCYRGVAEFSIYIAAAYRGKGVGDELMQRLIPESEVNGIWTLHSSTFPENVASVKLQKKYGFREIGYREKIAELHGVWRDTVLLERRSKVTGLQENGYSNELKATKAALD
ncbi:phosphinothricin acetyltransferase [Pontibacter aydingkolensis]|uniref:GNAT family N-acetyltransferase n=1 Tax=Pontibacter aydingkolensis TaxID=1911536 RepID=A0ABS7CXX9_9BACT|nr:GNAT family N-acetyltransferase [Pontibacter aydingkolensis]MBW7468699.1 GNAT family N-acetyltransferase [Pontibacter aydingkolensis]